METNVLSMLGSMSCFYSYDKLFNCIIHIRMANLSTFDLNLLRVLDALLEEHSTVKAGLRLGLSQPAVSAALGRLRIALGDELFFRRGQGLEPTAYANSLRLPLRDVLVQIETVIKGQSGFDPKSSSESFKISGSDFFAEFLMPKLAEQLQVEAPFMRVHLVDLVPDSHVETIERFDIDLALILDCDMPDWIESQPVFRAAFSVVARKHHPRLKRAGLSSGDVVPIDLFCDLGHVSFSPEGNSQVMGDAALAKVGRKRHVVMTMPVFSGVYRAVAESDLIALLPSALAHRVAPTAGLDVFRAPVSIPTAQLVMAWHRRYSASHPHVWLREQIAQVLAPLDCSS